MAWICRAAFVLLLVGIPLSAYVPRRILTPAGLAYEKWSASSVPIVWRLNASRGPNITGPRDLAEVARLGFQTWSSVPTAQVSFSEGPVTTVTNAALDQVNLISFAPTNYSSDAAALTVLYSFTQTGTDPVGRKVEFPGQILEADILINPNAPFSTDPIPPADRIDLQSQITHEIGHLLGLDHSGLASAAMFPGPARGSSLPRLLSADDILGLSNLYPAGGFFTTRGIVHGTVRTPAGAPVFGAHLVIVDGSGRPVVSGLTETDGSYLIRGLDPGSYSSYAEPLDGPLTAAGVQTIGQASPNQTPATAFTTRFAVAAGSSSTLTLAKTSGDNQGGNAGQALGQLLEVTARDSSGNAAPGVLVRFVAASGGGTIVPIQITTDALGKARTTAYLGNGSVQMFTASALNSSVHFMAVLLAPALESMQPSSGVQGQALSVTLTGRNFVAGSTTVAVSGTGVTPGAVAVTSPTSLTVTLAINSSAPLGDRLVSVSTPAGTTGTMSFTVLPPAPTFGSVNPANGVQGQTVNIALSGTNFVAGSTTVAVSGTDVTPGAVNVTSLTSLTLPLVIGPAAQLGDRTITVTTAGGVITLLFSILPPPPTLVSINPPGFIQGQTVTATLTGTNFVAGSTTVTVSGTGVTPGAVNVTGAASLTVSLAVSPSAPLGDRIVTVATAGGFAALSFTVLPPAPALESIQPASGVQGQTANVNLTGSNFVAGATTVVVSGTGVALGTVNVISPTSLATTLTIHAAAPPGDRSVTVSTTGGTSGFVTFTVLPPEPTLGSISPSSGIQGRSVTVTLAGTNFVAGATTVTVSGTGVTASAVNVAGSTSLTTTLNISSTATLGDRTVMVTTAGGSSGVVTLTLLPPPPTLGSINPTTGVQGQNVNATLTGTNFVAGATTVAVSGTEVTAGAINVISSTSLTVTLTISPNAALGDRTVTVTTSGGAIDLSFTVLPPAPTLQSINPASGVQSQTVNATLTGTNFVTAATTVAVSGTGVTVGVVNVVNSTTLAVIFTISPAASLGDRTVTITTAGGITGPLTLTVQPPPPALVLVSPDSGVQGQSANVTLTGTNFVSGATAVTVSGAGVTASAVNVTSTASLTVTLAISPAASLGNRTLTVTTAGGAAGLLFIVLPPSPTLGSIQPASGNQGQTVIATMTGMNFITGGTAVSVSGTGVTPEVVNVTSSASLTVPLTISPTASPGDRSVTVTTAGGTSGFATFTVLPPVITTVTGNTLNQGATGSVVVTGANLSLVNNVSVSGSDVSVSLISKSPASINLSIQVGNDAAPGTRTLSLTSPDGTLSLLLFLNPVTISGRWTFEKLIPTLSGLDFNNPVWRPIRRATVKAVNAATGTEIASATTNDNGEYSLTTGANKTVFIRVLAEVPSFSVKVVDNLDLQYSVRSPNQTIATSSIPNFSWVAADSNRINGPFNLLDVALFANLQLLSIESELAFPSLTFKWSYETNLGTSYSRTTNTIRIDGYRLIDANEMDDFVVLHEYGHFIMHAFSRDDSMGGAHDLQDIEDPRFAWSEGVASFIAAALLGSPLYIDTKSGSLLSNSLTYETNSIADTTISYFNEYSVTAFLWDLIDQNADGGETVASSFSSIWAVLRTDLLNERFVNFLHFIDHFVRRNPSLLASVTPLLSRHAIVYLAGQNPPFPNMFPQPLQVSPITGAVDSLTEASTNRFTSRRVYSMTATAGTLNVVLNVTGGGPGSLLKGDVTIRLYSSDGSTLLEQQTTYPTINFQASISRNVSPGTYFIEVLGFRGSELNPIRTSASYSLTVNQLTSLPNSGNQASNSFQPADLSSIAPVVFGTSTSANNLTTAVSMPFEFRLFGSAYAAGSSLTISSNGWVSFDPQLSALFTPRAFPNASLPSNSIAPYLADLAVLSSLEGSVKAAIFGTSPNRFISIEWKNTDVLDLSGTATGAYTTFQLLLYETSFDIKFQYITNGGSSGVRIKSAGILASAGIQGALTGGAGVNLSFREPLLLAGKTFVLRYTDGSYVVVR
ncbi:MAG: matrixin family metalloprotease [Acidobacteria bacterium]|nr:matrixin family metalloprotease [Acidobacteriota bacterium]